MHLNTPILEFLHYKNFIIPGGPKKTSQNLCNYSGAYTVLHGTKLPLAHL